MATKSCILFMLATALTAGSVNAEEINPVLGKARDSVIREADLDRIIASQPPSVQKRFQEDPQQRLALVREILTKKVIVAKARKDGFDKKPEIKEQLSYVFDSFITQEYLTRVVSAGITVPENDIKKIYQEYEKEFQLPEQVKVRHILIAVEKNASTEEKQKAKSKAESILQRIRKGEDFSALAREASDDQSSASKGGELAPFTAGKTNSEEFEKAAFALRSDQISGVIESGYGFHIIKMLEHLEKRTAPYGDVREIIREKLKADLEQKKIQEFVEQATKEAGLEIFGEPPAPLPGGTDKKPDNDKSDSSKK